MSIKSLFANISDALSAFFGCPEEEEYRSLSVDSFEEILQNDDVELLDVRPAEEFAENRISGAINIDLTVPDFQQQVLAKFDKHKTLAIYCKTGLRSKQAAKILSKLDYDVVELTRGFICWIEAGKPVEEGSPLSNSPCSSCGS